jgi:hypothetical protein
MPRTWPSLAKQKAPSFVAERRDAGKFQEGTSWFPFFRPFFVERQRKSIKEIRERAQQCERPAI